MVITDLWNSYLAQKPYKRTEREEALLEKSLSLQLELRKSLNDEQKEMFDAYEEMDSELKAIFSEHAFTRGLCFATKLLAEALNVNKEDLAD